MQDQMRFVDNEGKWYVNSKEVPSNHKGTYQEHGEWVLPVFPKALSLVGSPTTPYIWDSRCDAGEAASRFSELYNMSVSERESKGNLGREWAIGDEAGFTSIKMGETFTEGMEELFSTWTPRDNFVFLKDTDYKTRILKHKLNY